MKNLLFWVFGKWLFLREWAPRCPSGKKNPPPNTGVAKCRFEAWVGRSPWRREMARPLQYFAGKNSMDVEDYLRPLRVNSQFINLG